MWTYRTYRWPDAAAWRAAQAVQGWQEGAPPGVDLLVAGTVYEPSAPASEGELPPPVAIAGWWVSLAIRDASPPADWESLRATTPEGMPVLGEDPALTVTDYQLAVDAHVQATARARSYNGAATCASYVTSTEPAWRAEAAAFVAWRDAVYVAVFGALAAVQAGGAPPSIDALITSLPAMVWPA
ncbi:MAG: hypothetical protein JWR10_3639 [Rubritepida sp.]|nr:hypothetical protein [Rubritepida sp.]